MSTKILDLDEAKRVIPEEVIKLTTKTLNQFDGVDIDVVISVLLTSINRVIEDVPADIRLSVCDSLVAVAKHNTDEMHRDATEPRQ